MIDAAVLPLLDRTLVLPANDLVRGTRACKLCNEPAHPFDAVDFNKSCNDHPAPYSGILVQYFRCQRCELMFTDFCDDWSADDFSRYVYNDDYIKVDPEYEVDRPRRTARDLASSLAGAENVRILDYGSGSGAFAREMALLGFAAVESYDPFSHPVPPTGKFDLITCFEVIEHSPDPRGTLAEIVGYLADGGCLLVGQALQPADIATIRGNWWYVAPRNGHVTLYSSETMYLYARNNGLRFDDFGGMFALTHPDRSELTKAIIARRDPQPRRLVLGAPLPGGSYSTWHDAEATPGGHFRWTLEAEVSLGTHPTPKGEFRVILKCMGAVTPSFLGRCLIRAGTQESAMFAFEDHLHALFDFPEAGMRDISIRQPVILSPTCLAVGDDERPLGLAIACL